MRTTLPTRFPLLMTVSVLTLPVLAGCSGSGASVGPAGGDMIVLRTTPPSNGTLFLNEPIEIDFSNRVDLASADLNTVAFTVFDLNGNPVDEQPAGTFSLGRSRGDSQDGRRLIFSPRFPTNDTLDDGGFRPGRLYACSLVGGGRNNPTTIKDVNGRPLAQPLSFEFRTPDGATAPELFSDTMPGGPRGVGHEIEPEPTADGVALNKLGQLDVEIRLFFDQPLNPHSDNVPVRVSSDPLRRSVDDRGLMFLEYDDSVHGRNVWIPATVELAVNTRAGAEVVMRPIGVMPNNAEVRVIVENAVQDMSGESNVADASFNRVFATFRTRADFDPQYDAIVERFDAINMVDEDAPFLEPQASVANGRLASTFRFEGRESRLRYRPTDREVILNTDFTTIVPVGSSPINVSGGVFNLQEVEIPEGVLVRGTGTNPLVFLVSGDVEVDGHLIVDGGPGARVDTLRSANFPTPGGIGNARGGNGGRGSPNAIDRSLTGEPGYGPGQRPSGGGGGGKLSCTSNCARGSAGGGGSLGTEGDPFYPPNNTQTWPQLRGNGGRGCMNRTLRGGFPGPMPFTDTRLDNDFWGNGVDVFRGIRITGELAAPVAGSGGGGGGDLGARCTTGDPLFANDNKGGGGGGGAGVLIIQALGKIKIGRRGRISADGGHGGGGEQAGSNNQGGGGGGGSGGMVILMAGKGIEIEVHGNELAPGAPRSTYGELDYDFAISADGGIGTQGSFQGTLIARKYPPGNPGWNTKPTGGFGGLGIVQLMVPPGNDADGTHNALDDNISFFYMDANSQRVEVSPDRKKALLGWRGWADEDGTRRDERGDEVRLGPLDRSEGDIRPSPIMLPNQFSALSRAQSFWIELGSVARERVDPPTNPPPDRDDYPARVVFANQGEAPKPDFEFAGTRPPRAGFTDTGYVAYDPNGRPDFPTVEIEGRTAFPIAELTTDATFEDQPAYLVELAAGEQLGPIDHRYTHYRLQLLGANDSLVLGDFPILGHTGATVFLEPSAALPSGAERARVLAKFFEVTSEGQPGFGETLFDAAHEELLPAANLRIGFAFHTDPNGANGRYPDPGRPSTLGQTFAYDLSAPSFQDYLNGTGDWAGTPNRPRFVRYDVLFNTRFDPRTSNNDNGRPLTAAIAGIGLEDLRLPYRF